MKKYVTLVQLFVGGLISLGFADCHFVATNGIYQLSTCPTVDFQWPKTVNSSGLELTIANSIGQNELECPAFVKYRVKQLGNQSSRVEFDAYLKILKDKPCNLIIAMSFVGPRGSDTMAKETTAKLLNPIPNLLFQGTNISADLPPKEIEIIGNRDQARNYCKSFLKEK